MATAEQNCNDQITAYDQTADQMSGNRVLKYYTVTLGNTLGRDPGIEKKLHEFIPGLKNVLNSQECDFILVFLHFDLRAGTDIEEAVKIINTLSGDKPAILVVLHHTFDLKATVPDSSGAVNRKNTNTVDLLYCKDTGLLTCFQNDQALSTVINWINPENILNMGPRQSQIEDPVTNLVLKTHTLKHFTLATGNTLGLDKYIERTLQERIPGLQKVQNLEECDIILVFCPVVSQKDIETAVMRLRTLPDKPAVVVVLHQTSAPNTTVPDSSGAVIRKNTITVDLLFCKGVGLLSCYKNDEALSKVINWINPEGRNSFKDNLNSGPRQSQTHDQMLKSLHLKHFTLVTGNTLGHHVSIERKLQELIPGLQKVQKLEECDFILVFCPVVSQAGIDIKAAVNKLNTLPGNSPTVLVVLHHTFNPESVVPDSRRSVNRDNTLTVDCLFYEDQGLLHCSKNNEALSDVINWLREGILTKPAKQTQNQNTSANQMLMHLHKKYFTLVAGNTFSCNVGLERKFEELFEGLQEVQMLEECDFILFFCHVDSECGTDIEPALNLLSSIQGEKAAVVMVLHHTSDPNTVVPDSSGTVIRKNTITVDLLFCKAMGLLSCYQNDEALSKVINWINLEVITNMGPRQSQTHEQIPDQLFKYPYSKYHTLVTGNTLGHDADIERELQKLIPGLQKVQDLEECDFILVFCFVGTRTGNDIEGAVNMLNTVPDNKPAFLVVLHHTSDPNTVVPDSSKAVIRKNTITMDLLFCKDMGLLTCYKNDEALSKVINWIKPEMRISFFSKMRALLLNRGTNKSQDHKHITNQLSKIPCPKYLTLVAGNILGHDADIERNLQKLIPGLQKVQDLEECDFILVFCPVVSRAGTDIEAAMKKLNTLSGTIPAALMVLHHTFNPEEIVPDSRMAVKKDHLIAVDCLFHEDQGLLQCNKNNEAYILVSDWIKTQVLPKTKKGNMFNKKENMTTDESRRAHDLPGPAARRRRISDSSQDLLEYH